MVKFLVGMFLLGCFPIKVKAEETCFSNYIDEEDPIIQEVCLSRKANNKQVRLIRSSGEDIILTENKSEDQDRMPMKLDARSAKEFKKKIISIDVQRYYEDSCVVEYSGKLNKDLSFGWLDAFPCH